MGPRWRTASIPKTRAVPREGSWNPSRALMRVDLPAPLGPSRPMAWPRSSPVSPSRTTRPPSLTSSRSRSITGVPNDRSSSLGWLTGVPNDGSLSFADELWLMRTASSLGWLTPMLLLYALVKFLVPGIEQRAESEEIKSEQAAVAGHFDAAVLAEGADRGGPGIGGQ